MRIAKIIICIKIQKIRKKLLKMTKKIKWLLSCSRNYIEKTYSKIKKDSKELDKFKEKKYKEKFINFDI
jgi:hypothetical protein